MLRRIIRGYRIEEWWKKILTRIDDNKRLLENKTILPFEREDGPAPSADSYFSSRSELDLLEPVSELVLDTSPPTEVNSIDYTLFLFPIKHIIGVCRLCIPSAATKDVIDIAHGQRHSGFAKSYEIVPRS